ncbi:MAG: hypothetical protein BJ554DRAFT_401 [Olpidium bornovanus]|uniref:Uncharacterized protein n=1 Tax=Olpidium bornovanus TaxID=278681 RepID=A0A8H7ZTB5_9FUNG|nr:MAG: hypothetical protein BJ554DRAFT_401 [Olpidium bornovanus]
MLQALSTPPMDKYQPPPAPQHKYSEIIGGKYRHSQQAGHLVAVSFQFRLCPQTGRQAPRGCQERRVLPQWNEKSGRDMGGSVKGLHGWVDSSSAGCHETRSSTTGYAIMFGSALITWRSTRQTCVESSSTEAEFIAVSTAAQEISWLSSVHSFIESDPPRSELTIPAQSCSQGKKKTSRPSTQTY